MFAFKTIEPFTIMTRSPYNVPNCDVLMFTDLNTRKGSWILQTTEITDDLKGTSLEEELDNFKQKLLANSSIEIVNYESAAPQVKYTSMEGDILELTYFPPTSAYVNQYKINGAVQSLGDGNLYNSPYTKQEDKSDNVYIYNTSGDPTILNWNDPIPDPSSIAEVKNETVISCFTDNDTLIIRNIPAVGDANISIYNPAGEILFQEEREINDNQCAVNVANLTNSLYIVEVRVDNESWAVKYLR